MVTFPNAKINLGLRVVSKRPDGYHNIESVMFPIPLTDILEIVPSGSFSFSLSGDIPVDGTPEENLCVKAWRLLKQAYNLPPVSMHLHKTIPTGAGMGGGSSDGAFTLKMLNELFSIGLTQESLKVYASQLGADCPFFIDNLPACATGTGTELSPIDMNLEGLYLVLIKPPVHISTQKAYRGIKPAIPDNSLTETLGKPMEFWKTELHNDFEDSIFPLFPSLKQTKELLYQKGAIYASMSGSGSTIYGLFREHPGEWEAQEGTWSRVILMG